MPCAVTTRDMILLLRYYGILTPFGTIGSGLLYLLVAPKGLFWWSVVTSPSVLCLVVTTTFRMTRSCGVDHLVFTCPTLEEGITYIHELTGVRAELGGGHPGLGTHNALLSLGDNIYLEIIAPDPEQPEPAQPRPFSLDDSRTHFRLNAFAVRPNPPTSIQALRAHMMTEGFDPGMPRGMSRRMPGGSTLRWWLTPLSGHHLVAAGPQPFLIDWGSTPSPARSAPRGCSLLEIRCYGPYAREMKRVLDGMGLQRGLVEFCHHEGWRFPRHENNFLIATLSTPRGEVAFGEGWGR